LCCVSGSFTADDLFLYSCHRRFPTYPSFTMCVRIFSTSEGLPERSDSDYGRARPACVYGSATACWSDNGRAVHERGGQHPTSWPRVLHRDRVNKPRPHPYHRYLDFPPWLRGFICRRATGSIEDTWHVRGLKGTVSHQVALKTNVRPEANFLFLRIRERRDDVTRDPA